MNMISTFERVLKVAFEEELLEVDRGEIRKGSLALSDNEQPKNTNSKAKESKSQESPKTLTKTTYLSIFTQTSYDFIPFLIQIKLRDLEQVELVSKFRQFIKR